MYLWLILLRFLVENILYPTKSHKFPIISPLIPGSNNRFHIYPLPILDTLQTNKFFAG